MKILALQLKRIGDLVLTTPALRALRHSLPGAHIGLGVAEGNVSLLPAIAWIDTAIVFGRGRGFAPWQQVIAGGWDVCLDFTGTDRSALATALSRAGRRGNVSPVLCVAATGTPAFCGWNSSTGGALTGRRALLPPRSRLWRAVFSALERPARDSADLAC